MGRTIASRYRPLVWVVFGFASAGLVLADEPGKRTLYFPAGVFDHRADRNEWSDRRFSDALTAMKEPSLWARSQQNDEKTGQAYRFLWLRSFDRPVAIRVENNGPGEIRLFTKVLDGHDGDGDLAIEQTKALSEDQWIGLVKRVSVAGYWGMATSQPIWNYNEEGQISLLGMMDGADWVLEGKVFDDYHIVNRHSPSDKDHRGLGIYRELCLYILRLSDLDLGGERIY